MPSNENNWVGRFVAALSAARDREDRATLAKLRRGLTGHCAERDIWVFSRLPGGLSLCSEEAALLTAALFASHPRAGGRGSVGSALRQLRLLQGDHASDSLDKRLAALLDSHRDDLPARLRQVVSLLRSREVPIDWGQLLSDLIWWDAEQRTVQRRWARDYWTDRAAETNEPLPPSNTATAGGVDK